MNIINKKLIFTSDKNLDKKSALRLISEHLSNVEKVDKKEVLDLLLKREKEFSTGFDNGIAIPHASISGINEPKIIVTKWTKGIDWGTIDGNLVDLSIAIFVPKTASEDHLRILGKISSILSSKKNSTEFKNLSDSNMIKKLNEILTIEDKSNTDKKIKNYDLVGITSCPTGIAHTFMAAEAIEKEAKRRGMTVKIEKQGQSTVDPLTQEEIDNAKYVIFATGKSIEEDRFGGKEVLRVKIAEPMRNPSGVFDKLLDDKTEKEIIKSTVSSTQNGTRVSLEKTMDFNNFGSRIYNGVLSGVSYMLPFVVTGGILIAMSFLLDINNAGDSNYGNVNSFASWVNSFGGVAFGLMVPVLTAYMMYSIVGRQGLLLGMMIGFLAIGQGPNWIVSFNYDGWMPESAGGIAASGFIGGIIGAIMGSAIIIWIDQLFEKILPKSLQGAKLLLFLPLSALIIAGGLFWILNVPLTFVSWGIMWFLELFDSPSTIWIFGIIAGAMATVDYGGPVNKAAYLFGVFTLTGAGPEGSIYMAAVSAACIVPPLGIALATSFKRDKYWDEADIAAGTTNWILGATHITEGAIPFATKYPKDIYFQTMFVGALVGGASAALGIATFAPHGGVFTFALLKFTYVSDPVLQTVLGIGIYTSILAIGASIQASLILMSRKRTVAKEALENLQ